jgi:pseudouridine kinase
MTHREIEILQLIEANPLISQKELALALGIERSSVGVHISNLIKKGIIKGKGYLIQKQPYVIVIGGSNMDILGTPISPLHMKDSNPGYITTSAGGVGRNIAENLGRLAVPTKLLSVVGDDPNGSHLLDTTKMAGVDTHYMKLSKSSPTSIYMSVLDETGDMKIALSDMRITQEINVNYIQEMDEIIKQAQMIILDTNLEEEVLRYIVTTYSYIPCIVDTVSSSKAIKIHSLLSYLYCIKPNRIEAEVLYGHTLATTSDVKKALIYFKEAGVTYPMISLGKQGIAFLLNTDVMIASQDVKEVINTNGAGDAFTAGLTYGLFHGHDLSTSIRYGSVASRLTLEVSSTVNTHINRDLIHQQLNQKTLIIREENKGELLC